MAGTEPVNRNRRKIYFSTDALATHVDERRRVEATAEALFDQFTGCTMDKASNRPFHAKMQGVLPGEVAVVYGEAAISACTRTAGHVAYGGTDTFQIVFNENTSPLLERQNRRECLLQPGDATLISMAEPHQKRSPSGLIGLSICVITGERLRQAIPYPEDLIGRPIPRSAALLHLRQFCISCRVRILWVKNPLLDAGVAKTLIDLATLALGTGAERQAFAGMRGLRKERLLKILSAIRTGYTSATFSCAAVAAHLGLSQRYIQELLQESGGSFSERVQELRLQRTLAMLKDSRFSSMKIIDIALTSGFSDVSYFNRCFRQRFGMTPKQARVSAVAAEGNSLLTRDARVV